MAEREKFDPGSQTLMDLVNKYGLKNVPSEELATLGYSRDPLGSIVKADELEKRIEQGSNLENKKENIPFGRIKLELDSTEAQLRHELDIARKLDKNYNNERFLGNLRKNNPILAFSNEFYDFLKSQEFFEQKITEWNNWFDTQTDHFLKRDGDLRDVERDLGLSDGLAHKLSEIQEANDPEESKSFFEDIQRAKAMYADKAALKKEFTNWDRETTIQEWSEEEHDNHITPEFLQYCFEHEIDNEEKLKIHFLGLFLVKKGFVHLGEQISVCKTYDEASELAGKISGRQFPHFQEKKDIETQMSEAVTIEDKKALSKRKKEMDIQSRKENLFISELKQFLTAYNVVAAYFDKYLSEIEQASFRILITRDNKQEFYLDPTPNAELDRDPGQISGDCTEGKPLPFADSLIPVYNVKVFESKQKHIGNIYLLITDTDAGEKAWHLDAIQIPATIHWESATEQLFQYLGEKAKEKGIKYITVNTEENLISNYDYIGKAVMANIVSSGQKKVQIIIPFVDEGEYSEFQSTGEAYVVWENFDLSKQKI
ncbi:MAG: hypothetical protein ABI643_02735 [Candidatus Doudnabacteria bacterium]